jgi:hypothetical protein
MPEKNSNKTSLIVALVAVFLIVGGIYILNQSISQPRNEEEVAVVEEEEQTNSEDEFQSIDDMGSEDEDFPEEEEEESALRSIEEEEQTIEEEPVIEEEPEEEVIEEDEEESSSNLTEGQILVTYTGQSEEGYEKFKIVECGNKDLSSCRSGLNIMLSTKTSGIEEGQEYIINGTISDGDGGLSISGATVTKA